MYADVGAERAERSAGAKRAESGVVGGAVGLGRSAGAGRAEGGVVGGAVGLGRLRSKLGIREQLSLRLALLSRPQKSKMQDISSGHTAV